MASTEESNESDGSSTGSSSDGSSTGSSSDGSSTGSSTGSSDGSSSDGSSTDSSSEDLQQACNQDRQPSASSSQPASRKRGRTWNSARLKGRPENPSEAKARSGPSAASSAKSGGQPVAKLPMPKIDLRALFDYLARKRQQKKRRIRRPRTEGAPQPAAPKCKGRKPRPKRPRRVVPREKRKKRFRERYFQYPFLQKLYGTKHLPLRMEYKFEHTALQGFFKYIEMLKFEDHLKKSLGKLGATDDLEKDSLDSRKHKYLDDDGSLSPIEESNGEDMNEDCDTEDIGARIVENSCFILSSDIPEEEEKSKKKSKRKSNVPFERRSSDACSRERGISEDVVSVQQNSLWKRQMKVTSLNSLPNVKESMAQMIRNETRMNKKGLDAAVIPGCVAANHHLQKVANFLRKSWKNDL